MALHEHPAGQKDVSYVQTTALFTTTSSSPVQITGLTITVRATGRPLKITVYAPSLNNTAAASYATLTLWDGVVGSGTKIGVAQHGGSGTAGVDISPGTLVVVVTPAAGAKTYNAGLDNAGGGGTAQLTAAATSPALLLVEEL